MAEPASTPLEREPDKEPQEASQKAMTAQGDAATDADGDQDDADSENPSRIGRYTVERKLGSGGMADVFLCRQTGMGGFDRQVVVKRILRHLLDREDVIFMFLDEARLVAQLNHPNLVQIYDIEEQDGLPYLVMEYVRGMSFSEMTQRLRQRGVAYPSDLVAALGAQACAGLHAAHELRDGGGTLLSVVHRDVSLQNLLLSIDGVVKVIDFGVARARNRLSVTSAGVVKGHVGYIAPEALTDSVIDRRADVFTLGVVLYELCSGKKLFEGNALYELAAGLAKKIPIITSVRPDVDPALAAALEKALELDPRKRYESAAEFGAALQAVAMRGGRFVSPAQIEAWLEQNLPDELRAFGRHFTPRPSPMGISSENTQRQPSPFSTTIAAPPSPAPSSVSPVSSMVTSLALPQFPGNLTSMLNEISQQVRSVAPLVPMVEGLSQQVQGIAPAIGELSQQVRLMRRLYWPLVTLFWLFGLGLILLGVFMVIQASRH
jgi:serine/threonine-protein kinase